jgi:spore germination cell wall hydrolase CwlJ-like protein
MRASRESPKGLTTSFGVALLTFAVMPTSIAYQDLASLFARRVSAGERVREHLIASPFGTIHAATFSFPRPVGSTIPEPVGYRVASLNLTRSDVTGSVSPRALFDLSETVPPLDVAMVNRRLKGDRIVPRAEWDLAQAERDLQQVQAEELAKTAAELRRIQEHDAAPVAAAPSPEPAIVVASVSPDVDKPRSPALQGEISVGPPAATVERPDESIPQSSREPAFREPVAQEPAAQEPVAEPVSQEPAAQEAARAPAAEVEASQRDTAVPGLDEDVSPTIRTARIYFGTEPLGGMSATLEPWAPGQGPIVVDGLESADSALDEGSPVTNAKLAMVTPDGGETIARKGEVAGAGRGLMSPAERLGLVGEERAKHEKCLADAIYFEARGEPVRGQMAVAQVVMNRVFSGYYPDNVCGVVYQNSHRHLACQFTFACDGVADKVKEPDAWERAERIAHDTLDGKYWLPDVGKATHYHAYWVHPWWVRTMRKIDRIGVHTFYRPRRWGDGADLPVWGDAEQTAEALSKL